MKLYCSKILLFFLTLNILVTSSYAHNNKNKSYSTPRHTQTNRSLCEGDIQSSSYDNDKDMKSVKENFNRQTSQRFEEYEERMKEKRQKRKEQRDKNIQQIIEEDKREKSLAEKIEKGCLRCGCALGGVAASVGIFGTVAVKELTKAALVAAEKVGATEIAAATAKGAKAGMEILIHKLEHELGISNVFHSSLGKFITIENYLDATIIFERVKDQYKLCFPTGSPCADNFLFSSYRNMGETEGIKTALESAQKIVGEAVGKAKEMTVNATANEMEILKDGKLANVAATSYSSYSAIGYSVLAILIIVLILVIIYLVLRYRRKKKKNKKDQYTKLLKE
ncbi:rifin [Plasmodium reichenowi]|uniref:Rifin n=1 Tax=Plasmodium reichenowi TaxID=5854 RepID=A0A060RN24_PLARE|nr:rifin [Plasmodium reichenowi]